MMEFANDPALQSAVSDYRDFLSNGQMRDIAEARGKFDSYVTTIQAERDEAVAHAAVAEEIGRDMGRAEGEAKGEARGRMEIARSMLQRNMDISTVVSLTGLTEEEVKRLR